MKTSPGAYFFPWDQRMIFFYTFKDCFYKREIMFCDTQKVYAIQISVFIKFRWNTVIHIHLRIVCGCFCAVMAELNRDERPDVALSSLCIGDDLHLINCSDVTWQNFKCHTYHQNCDILKNYQFILIMSNEVKVHFVNLKGIVEYGFCCEMEKTEFIMQWHSLTVLK